MIIGFSTTNGPGVNMAIFGAMSPSIGNNAFSYPIPAGEEPPIVLDMACGAVAAGKIGTAQMYSEKPPHNWGLDENGEEADDPSKVAVILPAAGAKKGSALSVVMDVLCGPLSGGLTGIIKMFDPGDIYRELNATIRIKIYIYPKSKQQLNKSGYKCNPL